MTWDELTEVWVAKEKLKQAEKALEVWRRENALIVPSMNGLPKSKSAISRTERLALKIIDAEKRVDELQLKVEDAMKSLEHEIFMEFPDSKTRMLLVLRYVDCMYFRDIALVMGYSEAHIYYLHNKATKDLEI